MRALVIAVGLFFLPAHDVSAQTADKRYVVPVPRLAGPIAVTAESHPFAAAAFTQAPIDLAAIGYVEEEFFINGTGSVYDWEQDGMLSTRATELPYTTRILVRRPATPARFSGTILVDVGNLGSGFDTFGVWGQLSDHLLSNGHGYVALTVFARSIGALRMFDAARYGSLALPPPAVSCTPAPRAPRDPWNRPAEFFPPAEEGIRWDIMSQVGALLKSGTQPAPLGGLRVERVLLGMQSGGDLPTYVNAIHRNMVLAGGRTVFDGFIIKDSGAPNRVHACAPALVASDPRRIIRNAVAPVVQIMAQAEISPAIRRPDSDTPGDQFRRYELPGASHFDHWHFKYFPAVEDLKKVGVPPVGEHWTYPHECEPDVPVNDFPQPYFFAGAFANLERWVKDGTPPPRATPIEEKKDEFGNVLGGVRSPWMDVPVGTYHPVRTGVESTNWLCADLGYWEPFPWPRLEAIYGSYAAYAKRFLTTTEKLARERWITDADAEKIRATVALSNTQPRSTR
jgi:hypothetical protein